MILFDYFMLSGLLILLEQYLDFDWTVVTSMNLVKHISFYHFEPLIHQHLIQPPSDVLLPVVPPVRPKGVFDLIRVKLPKRIYQVALG